MAFHAEQVFPGVWHIEDALGVCMTLLIGEREALLVDTGYGLEDVNAFVRTLTDQPLRVLLTHGHHDHALGAMWFDEVLAFEGEEPVYAFCSDPAHRRRILATARERGVPADENAYMTAPVPPLTILDGTAWTADLGGLTARVTKIPGHTPGSAVVFVPERELLLTGDDWNPVTWLWFEESLPVQAYRRNLAEVLKWPFSKALCPHRLAVYDRAMVADFCRGLTDEVLAAAAPSPEGDADGIRTYTAHPAEGQILVFDRDKWEANR